MRFLVFVLFLLPIMSFAQQKKYMNFDENWQLSSSKYTQFYQCESYVLENGAMDGPFTCFKYGTDTLVKKYQFTNNVLDGEIFEYHNDGSLKLSAFYKTGVPIKEWKEWDLEGNLVVDKSFDEDGILTKDKNAKKMTEYEKLYFGSKKFEAPIYTTACILKKFDEQKYQCSQEALEAFYKVPPLPPSYFTNVKFANKIFYVKLKYKISEKGKIDDVKIIETSGDAFIDELAEVHMFNIMPFESAKEYGNPIKYWKEAVLEFNFKR